MMQQAPSLEKKALVSMKHCRDAAQLLFLLAVVDLYLARCDAGRRRRGLRPVLYLFVVGGSEKEPRWSIRQAHAIFSSAVCGPPALSAAASSGIVVCSSHIEAATAKHSQQCVGNNTDKRPEGRVEVYTGNEQRKALSRACFILLPC